MVYIVTCNVSPNICKCDKCEILHDKFGIPATARASVGVYNTKEDIDKLCSAIDNCKKIFKV